MIKKDFSHTEILLPKFSSSVFDLLNILTSLIAPNASLISFNFKALNFCKIFELLVIIFRVERKNIPTRNVKIKNTEKDINGSTKTSNKKIADKIKISLKRVMS